MEENVITKSQSSGLITCIAALVIVIALLVFYSNLMEYQTNVIRLRGSESAVELYERKGDYKEVESSRKRVMEFKKEITMQRCVMIVAISSAVVSVIIILFTAKTKLVITDKRVYGVAGLGKRVDIPVDSISSIGTGFFRSIIIASSSGRIVFSGLSNYTELHNVISNLIIGRQKNSTTPNNDIADKLTKLKDLLDAGIITQEEFEAKKKQLLGL